MNNADEIKARASDLSWRCIEPIILKVRGKSPEIKLEEFRKLNEGQKAIFSFHVYYDHAKNDPDSFVYWSRLYLANGFFSAIQKGAHYFSHAEYSHILLEIETTFTANREGKIGPLYERFRRIGEAHKIEMGKTIEANRAYFFSICR
jgi:hypothetical protein